LQHGYFADPRQEFLGLGAANLVAAFGGGYWVAGGLSQSGVNDKASAKTPLALVLPATTLIYAWPTCESGPCRHRPDLGLRIDQFRGDVPRLAD
jgi:Sulfate permease family